MLSCCHVVMFQVVRTTTRDPPLVFWEWLSLRTFTNSFNIPSLHARDTVAFLKLPVTVRRSWETRATVPRFGETRCEKLKPFEKNIY